MINELVDSMSRVAFHADLVQGVLLPRESFVRWDLALLVRVASLHRQKQTSLRQARATQHEQVACLHEQPQSHDRMLITCEGSHA
jgi:hypothetical protein